MFMDNLLPVIHVCVSIRLDRDFQALVYMLQEWSMFAFLSVGYAIVDRRVRFLVSAPHTATLAVTTCDANMACLIAISLEKV